MKKIPIVIISLAILMLILGGCPDVFSGKPEADHLTQGIVIPEGFGAVRVNITTGNARTAMPDDISGLEYVYSFIRFTTENENGQPYEPTPTADNNVFILECGRYKLNIKAYMENDSGKNKIAEGERKFTVERGTIEVPVTLRSSEGTGTFSFKIKYEGDISFVKHIAFTLLNLDSGDEIDLIYKKYGNISNTSFFNNEFFDNIPVGYYLLQITLKKYIDDKTCYSSKSEVVHIYSALTTTTEYDFTDAIFIGNIVFNTKDDAEGSLRYALYNAVDGDVIRVMLPPSSEIKLNSSLLIDNKSITLEGNGVTIAKGSNWFSEGQPILSITGDEYTNNKTITIKRIHFKGNGIIIPNANGGAIFINTENTVVLESCIFSGNKVAGAGGAIYSSKIKSPVSGATDLTMIVKGCTFYDNAGNGGGTIYNDGTLFLTGNLFYGNTANGNNECPIINLNTNVTSNGYNVVDVDFGTDRFGTGFNSVDGDKLFTELGITSGVVPFSNTFEPIAALRTVMPEEFIQGFPTTDFYGNLRTWPGAPGAVK
jgi:hypothetical protein